MLESLSSKAVLTKVKAMYGQMLTMADYEQLMHKSSVPACAAYLKNQTHYARVLSDVQETQIHRGALEALLTRAMFLQFARLQRYAGKGNRFFRDYHIARLEIQCILNCIRLFGNENQNEYIQSVPGYVVDYTTFDVLALGAVHSYAALMEALKGTPYYKVLGPLHLGERAEEAPLPLIEHALYEYYYQLCNHLIDRQYRGGTAKELHAIFATQAQMFNLRAIFRLKRFFGASPEAIERILLRYKGRLPRRIIDELVAAPDVERALEILQHTKYSAYFDADGFAYIEYSTGCIVYHVAKKYLTFSQHPATAFVAFLMLFEIEIENLMAIIEGVRYGLDDAQIRPLLIHGGA